MGMGTKVLIVEKTTAPVFDSKPYWKVRLESLGDYQQGSVAADQACTTKTGIVGTTYYAWSGGLNSVTQTVPAGFDITS